MTKYVIARLYMLHDSIDVAQLHNTWSFLNTQMPHWSQLSIQGISSEAVVCPGFGEPGWAPFCFLHGNPVFNAFDQYQAFIQHSVISLHDFLTDKGLKQAYGPSIILFTVFVRLVLFPINYQQIASSQKTLALNPKIKEIQARYPDDKDLQNRMVALLYEETKVE